MSIREQINEIIDRRILGDMPEEEGLDAIMALIPTWTKVEDVVAVLTYESLGHKGVVGQTVGADGKGFKAVIFGNYILDSLKFCG